MIRSEGKKKIVVIKIANFIFLLLGTCRSFGENSRIILKSYFLTFNEEKKLSNIFDEKI